MTAMTPLISLVQRQLRGRWARALVAVVLINGLLWYYLPLIAFFVVPWRRWALLGLVAVVAFGVAWWLGWRDSRRDKALDATVTGQQDSASREAQASSEEVRALRKRLALAIETLRRRGVKRLYDLPWYVLIGPPGSGKTTLLRHSGLHFPLATEGEDTIHGVGGTRLCDWWFADEAVLIDTAGRYTTQDSNRTVDRAGWLGFLEALCRARPRQPINGVVVMMSLFDVIGDSPDARRTHARQVRQRINELTERLGQRIPVYLLFNKFDRLTGFEAFFDDLDGAGRAQVWGATFALDRGQEEFKSEFSGLLERLSARVYDRLQTERALDRRRLIAGFPLQVGSLLEPLAAFVSEAFSGSKIDPAPMLRGVYFTSATQVGAPFDRLSGALARSFGIDQRRSDIVKGERGRAYFVQRLIREVILGEALLSALPPKAYRMRKVFRIAALSSVALAGVVGLVLIWQAERQARAISDHQLAHFSAYHDAVSPIASRAITTDDDLPALCDTLDQAAGLRHVDGSKLDAAMYLTPRDAAATAGDGAYEQALHRLLYPRLIWRLEHEARAHFDDPASLYDIIRVYLLMGGQGPYQPQIIQAWFDENWSQRFGGALNDNLRSCLSRHLGALLALPPGDQAESTPLDGDLVRRARIAFGHVTPSQRIYSRLRNMSMDSDSFGPGVGAWSPRSALGAVVDSVFARRSGAPMTDGVPAFYTGPGFAIIMHRDLPDAARAVADESWVMGRRDDLAVQGLGASQLEDQVGALWIGEAKARWTKVLEDLTLRLGSDPSEVANSLYLLSSPQSPLRDMIQSIVQAQKIPVPQPAGGKDQKPQPVATPADNITSQWNDTVRPLSNLLGSSEGGAPPIDGIIALISELDKAMASGAQPPGPRTAGLGLPDPAQRLRAEASRQPEPVATWLREIADRGDAVRGQAQRTAASDAFNSADGPGSACKALTKGHYPFDQDSTQDAPLSDFVRVFAPDGVLNQYIQSSVVPYVDTSAQPWRLRNESKAHPPFTSAELAAFSRVDAIRRAFFPAGGAPFLGVSLTLQAGDDVKLLLGGASIHPKLAVSLIWPGSDGFSPARIVRTRDGHDVELAQASGPWALFRLLGQAVPQGGGSYLFPDGEIVTATKDDGSLLPLSLFTDFTCPVVP